MIYIFSAVIFLFIFWLIKLNIDLSCKNDDLEAMVNELNEDNDGLCRENLNLIDRLDEKSRQ